MNEEEIIKKELTRAHKLLDDYNVRRCDNDGVPYSLRARISMNSYSPAGMDDVEVECFSCEKDFAPESHNDRDEGWFCDGCLENPEH